MWMVVFESPFELRLAQDLKQATKHGLPGAGADGAVGIALAEREHPGVIIMDLSLPIVDGWEATRRIKANAALQHIPIIALSSHAMRGMRKKSGRPVRRLPQ